MRIRLQAAVAAGVAVACGISQARAQHHYDHHDDVVRHNGHVDVQHHNVHHDGGHYAVQPQYVQPQYVQPQYVQPQYVQVPQPVMAAQPVQTQYVQAAQPVAAAQPAPAPPAAPVANQLPVVRTVSNGLPYQGRGVSLSNAEGTAVNYTLDNVHKYSMDSGQSQKLASKGAWVITFNRGGGFGDASYTLTEGSYEFKVGDQGWDVQRKAEALEVATPPPAPPTAPAANALPPAMRAASRAVMN